MNHKKIAWVAAVLNLALLGSAGLSELSAQDAVKKGAVLESDKTVIVREKPPKQEALIFVGSPGRQTDLIQPGEKVTVEEVDRIKVPMDEHIWLKVKKDSGRSGWVYYGNQERSENFKK